VAGPVVVDGRIWGALVVCSAGAEPLPAGTEDRIAAFAQLVSLAIENAETREALAASRARLVAAADEARRRIERDLHDGAQQRLVATALSLSLLQRQLEEKPNGPSELLATAREELDRGLSELRELARGLHPVELTDRGLEAAVRSLAGRVSVPTELRVAVPVRLDPTIEAAAYFFVSEALTNVGKYANAKSVSVELELTGDALIATVTDNGIGGADLAKGSGLRGLADRVQALGGRLEIESVRGKGTKLRAKLPTKVARVSERLATQRDSVSALARRSECNGEDRRRIARRPAGKRIDGVELNEPASEPEGTRRVVGGIARGRIERLDFDDLHAVSAQLVQDLVDEPGAEACSSAIGRDRGPQDLRRAHAAALHDGEADDVACVVDDPATVVAQVASHLVGHVIGEEVRQAGDDRRHVTASCAVAARTIRSAGWVIPGSCVGAPRRVAV
jgi:hypothetical protein